MLVTDRYTTALRYPLIRRISDADLFYEVPHDTEHQQSRLGVPESGGSTVVPVKKHTDLTVVHVIKTEE